MIKTKCDLGHAFQIPDDKADCQSMNCPECGLRTWNPKRPERKRIECGNLAGVVGDSDNWNPWVRDLSPLDPPRLEQAKKDGEVRLNPATGCWEGYCPTRADYRERCTRWGLTTDWSQEPRKNRREGRDEWVTEKSSGTKSFFI